MKSQLNIYNKCYCC